MKTPHLPRLAATAVSLLAAGLSTGCGTVFTLANAEREGTRYGYIYSGVRFDARGAFDGDYFQHMPPAKPLCVVDMPLSLLADTVVLPVTLATECRRWFRCDRRLLGVWKADEDMTVQQYAWYCDEMYVDDRTIRPGTRPTIAFTNHRLSVEAGGIRRVYSYRIVGTDTNTVEIVGPPSPIHRFGFTTIRFDETGLWYVGGWSGGEMHYRKPLRPPTAPAADEGNNSIRRLHLRAE